MQKHGVDIQFYVNFKELEEIEHLKITAAFSIFFTEKRPF